MFRFSIIIFMIFFGLIGYAADCPENLYADEIQGFNLLQRLELAKSQKLFQEIITNPDAQNYKVEIARAYIENALVHEWIKEEELSHANLDKAKEIIDEFQLQELLTQYHVRRSSIYRIFGHRNDAFEHAKFALAYKNVSFDRRHVRDGLMLYGSMHQDRDTVIYYKKMVIDLFLEKNDFLSTSKIT